MIQRLRIVNFQGHSETVLEFSPGVNTIVGTSDAGKSSIVRALLWAVTNRPAGIAFSRRDGSGTVEVELEVLNDDGIHIVRRVKGKRTNEYYVDKTKLTDVGQDVPTLVDEVLNIGELNAQRQLDPHYLVLDTPGAVGRTINEAIHLERVAPILADMNSRIRSLGAALDLAREELQDKTTQLSQLSGIPSIREAYTAVVASMGDLRWKRSQREVLVEGVEAWRGKLIALSFMPGDGKLDEIERGAIALQNVRSKRVQLERGVEVWKETKRHQEGLLDNSVMDAMESTATELESTQGRRMELQEVLVEMRAVRELRREAPSDNFICGTADTIERLSSLKSRRAVLESMIRALRGYEESEVQYRRMEEEATARWHALMERLKACPTCGAVASRPMKRRMEEVLS